MKKLILTSFLSIFFFLQSSPLVFATNATSTTSTPTEDKLELFDKNYDPIISNNRILTVINGDQNDSINALRTLLQGDIITIANVIVGAVTLIWIFILAFKMIFSGGNEDELSKYKTQLGWIIVGLATVSVAEFAGFQVFDPATKDLVGDPVATNNFHAKLMQINLFFQYLVGGLVFINCIRSGYNLIMLSDGEDEAIQKEKEIILSILFGVGLMLLSETIITGVIFANGQSAGSMQAEQGVLEIVGLINFALSFAAGACTIMLVLASLYYVSSLGNEDRANRAKQIITSCIMALVILFSAYTIVRFLI